MANIVDAILALDANAKVKVVGEDYDKITWYDSNPNNITVDQIKTKKAELDKVEASFAYQEQRRKEYPTIGDQLDDMYHNGFDKWKETIKTIKDKYPKQKGGSYARILWKEKETNERKKKEEVI